MKLDKVNPNLKRGDDGRRLAVKFQIKVRQPMSQEGWNRWGAMQKKHISKSKFIFKVWHSTKQVGLSDGILIQYLVDNRTMGRYLIDLFYLADNETYWFHGFSLGRTKTRVKLTKCLFKITIHDADHYKFTITDDWRFNRMWFRKGKKNTRTEE
jgi:hypothetical protein